MLSARPVTLRSHISKQSLPGSTARLASHQEGLAHWLHLQMWQAIWMLCTAQYVTASCSQMLSMITFQAVDLLLLLLVRLAKQRSAHHMAKQLHMIILSATARQARSSTARAAGSLPSAPPALQLNRQSTFCRSLHTKLRFLGSGLAGLLPHIKELS